VGLRHGPSDTFGMTAPVRARGLGFRYPGGTRALEGDGTGDTDRAGAARESVGLPHGPSRTSGMTAPVRARGLGFRYPGGTRALEGVELELEPGERVALIGPNGSGKSTLIRLLATDLSPSTGELELWGKPASPPAPELRRRIAYAADRPVHLEALTGAENLRFFQELRGKDPGGGGIPQEDPFRLGPALHKPVAQYSFGMRRKLLLSEALNARASLLLMDEPLVGLDPEGVEILGGLLLDRAERGVPVIWATNEVREVPAWASRVVFLHQGRVAADGSPGELLRRVEGRTRISVVLDVPLQDPSAFAGRVEAELGGGDSLVLDGDPRGEARQIHLTTSRGGALLPDFIRWIVDFRGEVRHVQVREPDLRDVFQELTGSELEPEEARVHQRDPSAAAAEGRG